MASLRLLTQSMKTHASAQHGPVEIQNDPLLAAWPSGLGRWDFGI